jgi:hypothetical protein
LRRAVPSFTVEIRRRSRLATTLSLRAPSSETKSPRAEFDRGSHSAPAAGFVSKEADPSPVEVASAPSGRILPSLVRDEPLRLTLRDAPLTLAESAVSSRAPKRPSQRKDQATKLPHTSSVSPHESQQVVEEQLTASRRMSREQSDEGAGASPRAQTRALSQVGGDSHDLALGAKAERFNKIAVSRDHVRAKPLPDDQRSTTRTDPPPCFLRRLTVGHLEVESEPSWLATSSARRSNPASVGSGGCSRRDRAKTRITSSRRRAQFAS